MRRPGRLSLVGSAQGNGSSTAPSAALPAGTQAGDVLYVAVHYNNAPSITDNNAAAPTTAFGTFVPAGYTASWTLYTRAMTGAEGPNVAYTLGTSQRWSEVLWVLRGVDPARPFDIEPANGNVNLGGGGNYTTIAAPGASPREDFAFAFAMAGMDSGFDVWSGTPSGWTVIQNVGTANNAIALVYLEVGFGGTTGDATFTKPNDTENSSTFTVFSVAPAKVPHPLDWAPIAAVA